METFRKIQFHQVVVNKTKFAEPSKGNSECIYYLSIPSCTEDVQKLPENRYLLAWLCFIFPFSCNSFTAALNIFLISSDISCQVFPFSALADGCIYGNVKGRSVFKSSKKNWHLRAKELLSFEGLLRTNTMTGAQQGVSHWILPLTLKVRNYFHVICKLAWVTWRCESKQDLFAALSYTMCFPLGVWYKCHNKIIFSIFSREERKF